MTTMKEKRRPPAKSACLEGPILEAHIGTLQNKNRKEQGKEIVGAGGGGGCDPKGVQRILQKLLAEKESLGLSVNLKDLT